MLRPSAIVSILAAIFPFLSRSRVSLLSGRSLLLLLTCPYFVSLTIFLVRIVSRHAWENTLCHRIEGALYGSVPRSGEIG